MRAIVRDMPRDDGQHCERPKAARRYAVDEIFYEGPGLIQGLAWQHRGVPGIQGGIAMFEAVC